MTLLAIFLILFLGTACQTVKMNGKIMEERIMKKALYILAAVAIFASCSKDQNITPETSAQKGPVKINFSIASPGGETKAVKQGWDMYDELYFWFNDIYEDESATNKVIRRPDLELRYLTSSWEMLYQVGELADILETNGTLLSDYPVFIGDLDGDGTADPEEYENRDVYKGPIYTLWVSGNNLINAVNGWTRYASHPADGHNYLFYMPACFAKPENKSPMVLSAGFTSNSGYSGGGIDYIYDPVSNSLSLVSATNVYQKTSLTFKFYTNFQVTVTGLELNHVYYLSCPQFGSNNMYVNRENENSRFSLIRMINAGSESAHFGLEEISTSDVYGEALFFGQGVKNTDPADFTFTLKDRENSKVYKCTKTGKTIDCSDTKLAAIKLKFSDFVEQ